MPRPRPHSHRRDNIERNFLITMGLLVIAVVCTIGTYAYQYGALEWLMK